MGDQFWLRLGDLRELLGQCLRDPLMSLLSRAARSSDW
jgi:hypothetical protein